MSCSSDTGSNPRQCGRTFKGVKVVVVLLSVLKESLQTRLGMKLFGLYSETSHEVMKSLFCKLNMRELDVYCVMEGSGNQYHNLQEKKTAISLPGCPVWHFIVYYYT